MARLINADEWDSFYADLSDIHNMMDSYDRGYTDAIDRVDDWMDAQTTIDAVPVVHGRWFHDWNNLYVCSECGSRETMSPRKLKNYCPNCGAKMDWKEVRRNE